MEEQTGPGFAERMHARGYSGLLSIIPPGATLTAGSRIPASLLGKIPGIRKNSGAYSGYDWRRHIAKLEDVRAWDRVGASIGIRADSTPAVDIDSSDPQLSQLIREIAVEILGPAPSRVGRAPKQILMYRAAEPFGRMRLWIDDRRHLVEILGAGQQFVIGGIHPATGQPYSWDRAPDTIDPAELTLIDKATANNFIEELTKRLKDRGIGKIEREGDGRASERSDADQQSLLAPEFEWLAQAVAAIPNTNELFPDRTSYLRMGYAIRAAAGKARAAEGFELFAEWAARWEGNSQFAGNDPAVVADDWGRMRGPYSVGWPWIAEKARGFGFHDAALEFQVDPNAPPSDNLGPLAPPFVQRLNARFAKVRAVANAVLYTPESGPVEYIPQAHWRDMLANELEEVSSKNGSRFVPRSKLWMEHPRRRTYDRIVFDPTQPTLRGIPSTAGAGLEDFNLYPGLAVAPSDKGSCALFLAHLRDVICCGNQQAYEWVMMWLAAIVQRPERLSGTALVLRGAQGAGKTIVGEMIGAILGPRLYTIVSGTEELTGRFNAHQEGRLLIQVEEAFFAGNPSIVGKIKNMITAPTVRIERKHVDAFTINNYARIVVTSNEGWVIPAGEGERRFMVLDVSPLKAKNREYFGALHSQMHKEGGLARLLHHLLYEVNVDWDVIASPIGTDALRDQQIQTLEPGKHWLLELLNEGMLPGDTLGEGRAWTESVRQSYMSYMRDRGAQRRATDVALGKLLAEYGVEKRERRNSGRKRRCYEFPTLPEIREAFAKSLATAPAWDDVESWQANDPLAAVME